MFEGMRVVVVTPAGRRRYLEVLFRYIEALRPVVDEYRLWLNTTNTEDIAYMVNYQSANSDYVTLEHLPPGVTHDGFLTIHHFFRNCVDENTLYVRFDDDIIYVDTLEKFKGFLSFRKNNPQYFLVYGNIINNAMCTHLHQRTCALGIENGIVGYECMDPIGWNDGRFAKELHTSVIKQLDDLSPFRIDNWLLYAYERVSINVISWRGDHFKKSNIAVDRDEENFLASIYPKRSTMKNIIYGDFLSIHYAFYTQREVVDADESILAAYVAKSLQLEKTNSH